MMWRTTYAFGAFSFGFMLAYLGFLLGSDTQHGIVFRIFAATPLLIGACVCAITAVRELRGDKSKRGRRDSTVARV